MTPASRILHSNIASLLRAAFSVTASLKLPQRDGSERSPPLLIGAQLSNPLDYCSPAQDSMDSDVVRAPDRDVFLLLFSGCLLAKTHGSLPTTRSFYAGSSDDRKVLARP